MRACDRGVIIAMQQTEAFAGTIIQVIVLIGAVALLVGFYFLLKALPKMARNQAKARQTTLECQCGYDLRGSIKAKQDNCPECGRPIVE